MVAIHEIVAVEKGTKARASRALTDAYHAIQRGEKFNGLSRVYTPKDDDGDQLPAEGTLVQSNAEAIIKSVTAELVRLFDVVATKDLSNCDAFADIVVDGKVVVPNVNVATLLFLEKQLGDVRTFISKLPTLDPGQVWHYDAAVGVYATEPIATIKTKKVPRVLLKAEATDRHPAQTEVWHEDVPVGTWSTTKFSGALPADRVTTMLERVDQMLSAVQIARQKANTAEVTDKSVGRKVLDYVFSA